MCRRRPLGFGVAVKSSKRKQGELEISGAVAVLRSVPLGWPPGHLVLRSIPRNRTRTPTAGYVDAAWSSRFRDLRLRYFRYQSLPWVDRQSFAQHCQPPPSRSRLRSADGLYLSLFLFAGC